ncbi:MAG: hypothetical protein MR605_05300 [Bacteroidales bacterium]|nr:hypothetical protein [Bacteroidales bacterium]MDD6731135.1 hypothetical protein [Bacteroidales bacterium]MDY4558784.1 hypothetical protein [Alloprevotella sp.]
MEQNKNIVMLRYRIDRYRAMGNGTMCQTLQTELNRLTKAGKTTGSATAQTY